MGSRRRRRIRRSSYLSSDDLARRRPQGAGFDRRRPGSAQRGRAGANASFAKIGSSGGTYIASGVKMGVAQITASGTGGTGKRSGIVVFTDGEV